MTNIFVAKTITSCIIIVGVAAVDDIIYMIYGKSGKGRNFALKIESGWYTRK